MSLWANLSNNCCYFILILYTYSKSFVFFFVQIVRDAMMINEPNR